MFPGNIHDTNTAELGGWCFWVPVGVLWAIAIALLLVVR